MTDDMWSIDKAKTVFGVGRNDLHFLDISESGELCIKLQDKQITVKESHNSSPIRLRNLEPHSRKCLKKKHMVESSSVSIQ